jgi:hypothetical protein
MPARRDWSPAEAIAIGSALEEREKAKTEKRAGVARRNLWKIFPKVMATLLTPLQRSHPPSACRGRPTRRLALLGTAPDTEIARLGVGIESILA